MIIKLGNKVVNLGYPGLKAGAADPPGGVISKPAAEAGSICSDLVLGGPLLELRAAQCKPAVAAGLDRSPTGGSAAPDFSPG